LNDFHLLDISQQNNYKWITQFTPPTPPQKPTTDLRSTKGGTTTTVTAFASPVKPTNMVGILIGGIVSGVVMISGTMIFAIWLIYKRNHSQGDPSQGYNRDSNHEPVYL
jgi:hypothetical protein